MLYNIFCMKIYVLGCIKISCMGIRMNVELQAMFVLQ